MAGQRVRASVRQVLDVMTEAAAFARNGRLDILAVNKLCRALYAEVFAGPGRPANLARFIFGSSAPSRITDCMRSTPNPGDH